MDGHIIQDIQYYLCLALARIREKRFLTEVQKVSGPDHNFLMGFYYRLRGRYDEAIERLSSSLNQVKTAKARREIVQVLINIEEFEQALELARENYYGSPQNAFHIQAYFTCLIGEKNSEEDRIELRKLLDTLEKLDFGPAREMYLRLKAQYLAYVENDKEGALKVIDDAVRLYPENPYALITKFSICELFSIRDSMEQSINQLEALNVQGSGHRDSLVKMQCRYLLVTKGSDAAVRHANDKIRGFPSTSKEKFVQRLREGAQRIGVK